MMIWLLTDASYLIELLVEGFPVVLSSAELDGALGLALALDGRVDLLDQRLVHGLELLRPIERTPHGRGGAVGKHVIHT